MVLVLLFLNEFIYKYFLHISVLTHHMVNMNSYNPQSQKLLEFSVIFKSIKDPQTKKLENSCCTVFRCEQGFNFNSNFWEYS